MAMEIPKITVAVLTSEKIDFVFYGEFFIDDKTELFSGKYSATIEDGEIKVYNDIVFKKVKSGTIFNPSNLEADSIMIKDVLIGIDFHWEQKKNQRFKGALKLIIEDNKLIAINYLTVEDYLISVISSEMSATSSIELLKAHAIISRSWLFAQIQRPASSKNKKNEFLTSVKEDGQIIKWYDREDHINYDVCADDHCQRYQGITKLHAHNAKNAVEATKGMVLYYDDELCDARFSKSCGGITESFENVWEPVEHEYLQSIVDYRFTPDDFELDLTDEANAEKWIRNNPPAFCNSTDKRILSQVLVDFDQTTLDFYRWKVEYSQEEIKNLIQKKSGIDFGDVLDLIPISRGKSGRLIKLKIVGSKQVLIIGKELEIRKYLSESHLYSSAFVIDKYEYEKEIPQKFVIVGAGWGHGVGLCQIGAAVMSERGYHFDEILSHYFKNSTIKKIY